MKQSTEAKAEPLGAPSAVRFHGKASAPHELTRRHPAVSIRLRRLALLLASGKWAYVAGFMLPVSQVVTVNAPLVSLVGDSTESHPR